MQNDIEIEQLSKLNEQKDEKLRKMKSNIQKLQNNMNRKRQVQSIQGNTLRKQPITAYNNINSDYSSQNKYEGINSQPFGYNSNLFRQLNNQSQAIVQNGSAVSNFSSVSNINNLLNGGINSQQQKVSSYEYPKEYNNFQEQNNIIINKASSFNQPNILNDIDKLLQKTKNSKVSSFKGIQKFVEVKESKYNNQFSQNNSKILQNQGQSSTRNKLNEYKKFIDSLGSIKDDNKVDKLYKTEENRFQIDTNYRNYNIEPFSASKNQRFDHQEVKKQAPKAIETFKKHKKDEFSYLTNKTQYIQGNNKSQLPANEQSFIKYPPTPPLSAKKPATLVQRQKAQIKESMQQYKRLQHEIIHDQDRTELDFQLSDDDSQQKHIQGKKKSQKVQKLLAEKSQLLKELEKIDKQLEQLQNTI